MINPLSIGLGAMIIRKNRKRQPQNWVQKYQLRSLQYLNLIINSTQKFVFIKARNQDTNHCVVTHPANAYAVPNNGKTRFCLIYQAAKLKNDLFWNLGENQLPPQGF